MTISEIQQLENSRKSPDSFGRIHFIKEGNFYRAHDVSAWLITMMPFSEAIKNVSIIAKKLMTSDIMRYCVFNRDMTQAYDRRKFYEVNPKRGFGG